MTGGGGAVASVDQTASQVGIDGAAPGGNAADAAVATAGTLGSHRAVLLGHRWWRVLRLLRRPVPAGSAPSTAGRLRRATFTPTVFTDAATARPLDFATVVSSGLSVGRPGHAGRCGTRPPAGSAPGTLARTCCARPSGWPATASSVDATFAQQTADNAARFQKFPATAALFLPGGAAARRSGSTFRNPDLADDVRDAAAAGRRVRSTDGAARAATSSSPRAGPATAPGVDVYPGQITAARPRARTGRWRPGTHAHGATAVSMSMAWRCRRSGGIADRRGAEPARGLRPADRHLAVERRRGAVPAPLLRGVGDRVRRPQPLDRRRAWRAGAASCSRRASRTSGPARCSTPTPAQPRPIAVRRAGRPVRRAAPQPPAGSPPPRDDQGTTHLVVADRWGNVASLHADDRADRRLGHHRAGLRLPAQQRDDRLQLRARSATAPDPNLPGPGKRPRSSMSPTIVLRTADRAWRSARPAAPRSSPRCCRC